MYLLLLLIIWIIISILIFVFSLIYLYSKYKFGYWKRCAIPFLTPKFPLGNNECIGFEALSYGPESVQWYNEIKIKRGLKLAGVWSWCNPLLVLTDLNYIKDVLLKDFNYFADRDFFHNPKNDPKSEHLFVLEQSSGKWKTLRQKVSTAFTPAKIRSMFEVATKYAHPMLEFLDESAIHNKDIDILEISTCFAIDVIGGTAFSLEYNSFDSKNKKFRQVGEDIFNFSPSMTANVLLSRMYPKLAQTFGASNMSRKAKDFFTSIVIENIKFRKENNIKNADIMQILIDYSEENKNFRFDDIVGNVLGLFQAGFVSAPITITAALYELCRNPEIQVKLREEIVTELNRNGGELTYEAYQNMSYLRQVIDETLRMYPPIQTLSRVCVKPYTFSASNFTVDKGITVIIPALAIGHDPEFYPDPEKFDPERFNVENKANRNPMTFLPFGEGPRSCLGRRLGIMEIAIGIIELLRNFHFKISPNTKLPLTAKQGVFLRETHETLYLRAEKL